MSGLPSWSKWRNYFMHRTSRITSQGGPISLILCSFERTQLAKEKEPNNGKLDWSGKKWTINERIMKNEFFEFSDQNHRTSCTFCSLGGSRTFFLTTITTFTWQIANRYQPILIHPVEVTIRPCNQQHSRHGVMVLLLKNRSRKDSITPGYQLHL